MNAELEKAANEYATGVGIEWSHESYSAFIAGAEWALKQQSEALEKAKQDGFEEGRERGESSLFIEE